MSRGRIKPLIDVRADNRNCRLTYWLNRRLYSAPTAYGILFQQPHTGAIASRLYKSTIGNPPPVERLIPLLWRGGKLRLTGWHSPPVEGWQAPLDGVVFCVLTIFTTSQPPCATNSPPVERLIPLLWRGGKLRLNHHPTSQPLCATNSPPVEGWQAPLDGVVVPGA